MTMMNLNNLKTGKRLAIGFGGIAALLLMLCATAWWEMTAINQNLDIAMEEAANMNKTQDVCRSLDSLYLEMYDLVAAKDARSKRARPGLRSNAKSTKRVWRS
jgi:hypothetical protein